MTKYVTKFAGAARGSAMQMAEQDFEKALKQTESSGHGMGSTINKFFNAQAPSVLDTGNLDEDPLACAGTFERSGCLHGRPPV